MAQEALLHESGWRRFPGPIPAFHPICLTVLSFLHLNGCVDLLEYLSSMIGSATELLPLLVRPVWPVTALTSCQ